MPGEHFKNSGFIASEEGRQGWVWLRGRWWWYHADGASESPGGHLAGHGAFVLCLDVCVMRRRSGCRWPSALCASESWRRKSWLKQQGSCSLHVEVERAGVPHHHDFTHSAAPTANVRIKRVPHRITAQGHVASLWCSCSLPPSSLCFLHVYLPLCLSGCLLWLWPVWALTYLFVLELRQCRLPYPYQYMIHPFKSSKLAWKRAFWILFARELQPAGALMRSPL